jgi:superfamily II DNA/RNA helicase
MVDVSSTVLLAPTYKPQAYMDCAPHANSMAVCGLFMNDFIEQNTPDAGDSIKEFAIENIANDTSEDSGESQAPQMPGALAESDATEAAQALPNPFAELGLSPALLKAIADLGYTEPTAVQARVLPLSMTVAAEDGQAPINDLMVSSQTGSGKTAAFLLPILHRLDVEQRERDRAESMAWAKQLEEAASKGELAPKKPRRKNPTDPRNFKPAKPYALILCPTRELAQQVANDAIELVRHMSGVRVATVIGGLPYQLQISKLQNASLVVATPGRLLDLQRNGQIKCEEVKCLVLDEADRMLDLGFSDDLAEIHALTEKREQTLMFSATFAPRIMELATRVMHDGGSRVQRITIDRPQEQHANIKQTLYWADNLAHKRKLLDHWMRDTHIQQAIVFASTQIECDALAQDLIDSGFDAAALHGALSQGLRNRRLRLLREGHIQFLVATDVAARGIDVPSISHVFNYGLPMKPEDYTHRIGRTGRAGRDGLAVTFAEPRDRFRIRDIEDYTKQPLKSATIAGLEPTERVKEKKPSFGKSFNKAGGFGNKGGKSFGGKPARGFGSNAGGGFGGTGNSHERGFERGSERGGDRGFERGADRGFERSDRGDRGFERSDRGDRGFDRGERGFDRPFDQRGAQPRFDGGGFNKDFGNKRPADSRGGDGFKSGFKADYKADFKAGAGKTGGFKGGSFKGADGGAGFGKSGAGKPPGKPFVKSGFKPAGKPAGGKTFAAKGPRK